MRDAPTFSAGTVRNTTDQVGCVSVALALAPALAVALALALAMTSGMRARRPAIDRKIWVQSAFHEPNRSRVDDLSKH